MRTSPPSSRVLCLWLLVALLFTAGCGEEGTKVPDSPPALRPGAPVDVPPARPADPPPASEPRTPEEIGRAAGEIYVETLKVVVEALAAGGTPADLTPRLVGIREAAIGRLVLLGRTRATFDAPEKALTDAAIARGLSAVPPKVFEDFLAVQKRYAAEDRELGNLIASFNILTQYANFELLKQQAPSEASRLGVD